MPQKFPPGPERQPYLPALGCFALAAALAMLCLMPLFLVNAMQFALEQLGLTGPAALAIIIGMFLGGLVNLPVYRIEREEEQVIDWVSVYGLWGLFPRARVVRSFTIIAVNLGGCVIPAALAAWQVARLLSVGGAPLAALAVACACNVAACYFAARPVNNVGIVIPGFVSPAVAIGVTCLTLLPQEYAGFRAPVAFTAGVAGPLIGADLLHLKDITKVSTGMLSIGGAGTFDGIVLSSIGAALVCGLLAT